MDFNKEIQFGFLRTYDLDKMVVECRRLAKLHGLVIRWSIKEKTVTAKMKMGNRVTWQQSYSHDMPHMALCLMYAGIHSYLSALEAQRLAAAERMKEMERIRNEERRIAALPTWGERNGK